MSKVSSHASRVWTRQSNLSGERLSLHLPGGVVVVVVEPALSHADDDWIGVPQELGDSGDAVDGVVGMKPDCRPDAFVGPGYLDGSYRFFGSRTNGDHPGYPGRPRRLDRRHTDLLEGDVAVAVSPHDLGR